MTPVTGARLRQGALDVAALTRTAPVAAHGASVVFVGWVRDHHDNRAVRGILYHAYAPLAERRLREIESAATERFGAACQIWHASGELVVGDASVVVICASAHRAQAFEAARFAIDTVKTSVPIWKEERFADGASAFVDGVALQQVRG